MASTPATLTIEFVSNYAGAHRVCYRIGGSGPYTCALVNCTGGGATCSYDISVNVDNETCPVVNFNGYAQAACEDINSTNNRIPFSYDFTPNPTCKRYTVTCESVGIASITITNGGSGYTPGSHPVVLISGGGGSGATATATANGSGVITSIILNTTGSGYTSIPAVTIAAGGGGGVTATAEAVLGPCTELTSPGCSGSGVIIPTILALGESTNICSPSAPTIPSDFSSVENGNCACNCVELTLSVTGTPGDTIQYFYTQCNGVAVSGVLSVGGSPAAIIDCIVSGSLITNAVVGSPAVSAVYGASCP